MAKYRRPTVGGFKKANKSSSIPSVKKVLKIPSKDLKVSLLTKGIYIIGDGIFTGSERSNRHATFGVMFVFNQEGTPDYFVPRQ